jgi:hypothetical protein
MLKIFPHIASENLFENDVKIGFKENCTAIWVNDSTLHQNLKAIHVEGMSCGITHHNIGRQYYSQFDGQI